jgi:pimeloyl-ACP methyl ester carboxylesterase
MKEFHTNASYRVCFEVSGSGKAVVFLHGFMESLSIWEKFKETLSESYQIITVDLPGHGCSEQIATVHTMEMMADSVKSVLDSLKISECVIIGHSMGGYVALAFSKSFPVMVKGLGLFHSTASADTPEVKVNRDRMIKAVKQNKAGFIRQFMPSLFSEYNRMKFKKEIEWLTLMSVNMTKHSIIAAIEGMKLRTEKIDFLKTAKFRVLYISGKNDTRIPPEIILQQASIPLFTEVYILEGVGHMGFIEAASETTGICLNFINKCYLNN